MIFTSEDPAGGGPAAALVAGVRRALAESSAVIVTLPADAPLGGEAAMTLLRRLEDDPTIEAVVGIDSAAGSSRSSLHCSQPRLVPWSKPPGLAAQPEYRPVDYSMRSDPDWSGTSWRRLRFGTLTRLIQLLAWRMRSSAVSAI